MGENLAQLTANINDVVWGLPLIIFLVGSGIILTVRLAFFTLRMLPEALVMVFKKPKDREKGEGDISHFQALMTALASDSRYRECCRCSYCSRSWRSGCSFLDVDYSTCRNGYKIFRSNFRC